MHSYRAFLLSTTAIAALALGGCATIRDVANCQNAAKVRAAAETTIALLDRACPTGLVTAPPPAATTPLSSIPSN